MFHRSSHLMTGQASARKVVKKISVQGLYWAFFGGLFLFGFTFFNAYTYLMRNWGDIESFSTVTMNSFLILVIYLFLLPLCVWHLIRLKGLERKRHNITPDSPVKLAAIQPQPNYVPLQAPLVIEQRINWAYFFKNVCYTVIVIFVLYAFGIGVEYLLWRNIYMDVVTWLIMASVILFSLFIISLTVRSAAKEQLIAMGNGLLKKANGKEEFMPWHEVRLFAIDPMNISDKNTSVLTPGKHNEPTFFELSSEQAILQWRWLHPPRWYELTVAQPVVSYEAYNQQMQALLSIIAAKTGQPLYDLR